MYSMLLGYSLVEQKQECIPCSLVGTQNCSPIVYDGIYSRQEGIQNCIPTCIYVCV